MSMEPRSKQEDSGVVNITRAIEALSPWLNNPRRTIFKVEVLVLLAAALLLVQLILGYCRRRWHNNCFIKYGLQVPCKLMNPLIIYTLGTMQSSPIKNSSYPVWAGFLIMASAGTTAVRQYDFCGSFLNKYMQVMGECFLDVFYLLMFAVLLDPNTYKSAWDPQVSGTLKESTASSNGVLELVLVVTCTKFFVSLWLVAFAYKYNIKQGTLLDMIGRTIHAVSREETTANDAASDSCPQSMKGYKYEVCYRLFGGGSITIDQIWDSCGNSAHDGNALKDMCLSYALSQRLLRQQYFGRKVYHLKDHDFVFKKLLHSQMDFKRAFRIIEVELGFCYDFFFTKYYFTFFWSNLLPVPLIQCLILFKIYLILRVGVFAITKSLVLETPNPIIEVGISEADYIITILVVVIALLVDLVHEVFYLASNWARVSLACMHVRKYCCESNAFIFIFGKVIGFVRRVTLSAALRNKIHQYSFIFGWKPQPDPVEVSDAVKEAIATSLISTYGSNLATSGETSVRLLQNQMSDQYSWALKDLCQLEVMLIWHIATEYCGISDDPSNENGTNPGSNHRELADEVMDYRRKLSGFFYRLPEIYSKMKNLEGTQEEDDPRTMFQKGVKLEVMLIWHIATEYCDAIPDDDRSDGNGTAPRSNHLVAQLFGCVLQLLRPNPRRNSIARDGHRGVAVHLSRYCAYLIRSLPELLPYHKANIVEVAQEVMEERKELYGSDYSLALIYNRMTQEEEDDDPRKMFQKGVKLCKQPVRTQDGDRRWEVLKDFWAETIIHVAASHYTAKQHMQHLENGGEFLTHI
ncbi:unnamed protein product [Miscanthus lutarioriparius]|uniref:DUF4220 domain-containing protein n=1 Tax=Miscanthus lutarioriparius TaxID=422564 RepID=A0A811NFF1_9POAL|nr:unnamed protein product [Miscanthus lutarioriparius]